MQESDIQNAELALKKFTDKEYEKLDSKLSYKQDKIDIIKAYNKKNKTKYKHFTEMIYKLFMNRIMTVNQIADLFEMTQANIRYHLKYKMGCDMLSHGGSRVKPGVTGIPGVYPARKKGSYTVWYYKRYQKVYIRTSDSLFMAVWHRRVEEIRNGFEYHSRAQDYINKNWRNIDNI